MRQSSRSGGFLAHLAELRTRLVRIALVLVILVGLGIWMAPAILKLIIAPYGSQLKVISPTESVGTYLQVAMTSALACSIPYVLLEIWGFVAPALRPREKMLAGLMVPAGVLLFAIGVAFTWFLMIPAAIQFLAGFDTTIFKTEWTSQNYVPFVASLLFWVGLCFELPLAMFILARFGIVTARMLLRFWRFAVVIIVIIAAVITPTVDPFNLMLVALPLVALYFVSILFAGVAGRGRKRLDSGKE